MYLRDKTAILFFYAFVSITALPKNITIGGLFDNQDETLEIAFRYAVEKVNYLRWLLPNSRLLTQIERLDKGDSYMASQRVCSMLKNGIAAFFGPQSEMTTPTVQSICDTLEIPHIETRWDYRMRREDYSLNLFPHPGKLSQVMAEIVRKFDWWHSFAILYEDSDSLARVQDILKLAKKGVRIISWQLPEGDNYRSVLQDIKRTGQTRIVLDCSTDILPAVLKQAQQVGMMTENFEYFVTNLDMQIIDYDDFKYSGTNITGIRLLDPTKSSVGTIIGEWKWGELGNVGGKRVNFTEKLKTEAALVYDAVMLFASALTRLDGSNKIDIKPLSCDSSDSWVHGNSLINYMRLVQSDDHLPTLTGSIKFGNEGFRNEFHVDVIRLTPKGFEPIGFWSSSTLNITWPIPQHVEDKNARIVYNVATKFDAPYFSNRTDSSVLTGNDRYEGFVVDLMTEVAEIANFSYNFILAPDNGYGSEVSEGVWNGMIGQILTGKAQIAIADLTITSDRERVVDFSTPFLNLGISLLYKEKTKQPPELFSFLSPFSLEVWLYMSAAYTGVSLILFILARFSPYEWDNPYPCIQDPDTLENNFTLMNSLWFTIGTVMQQGSDIAPRAPSTRIVGAMWSFFTLIMISSYTANLAAFLVAEPRTSPIEFIEDLPEQGIVTYGYLGKASTAKFFETGTSALLKKIQRGVASSPNNLVGGNEEGVTKVLNENYAYFMESTTVDYKVNTNCGLRKVLNKLGTNLDSKGYGMAVNKNDPLRSKLTSAILKLQEEEKLQAMWQKWWVEKPGTRCPGDDPGSSGGSKALNLNNVGGVFVVLISGMGMACVIAIIEFMWNIRNSVKEGRGSLCSELINDLKFVVKCHGSTKPVRKPSTEVDRDSNFMRLSGNYNGFQN